jgi:pSer/pThr/pTyr-binding forkhead associated (FHA) protein
MMNLRPDDPIDSGPDTGAWLSLRGFGELADGQHLKLGIGESMIIGRSRHCDWSLRRAPAYLTSDPASRGAIKQDLAFNSVSRQHVRITYSAPDRVEVRNLSGNGTLVDGVLVEGTGLGCVVLTDVRFKSHRIQLGPAGIELELAPGSLPV